MENELQETYRELLQDAVLLEALVRWTLSGEKTSLRPSEEELREVFRRVFDYTDQHIRDLRVLSQAYNSQNSLGSV